MKIEGFGRRIINAFKSEDKVVATPMEELSSYVEDGETTIDMRPATLIITSDPYIVSDLYGEMLLTKLGMKPDLNEYPMHHFKILDKSFGYSAIDKDILDTGEATDYKHERRRIMAVIIDSMVPEVLIKADAFRKLGIPVSYSPRVEVAASLVKA